jgi:hypothetical protein
MAGGTPGWYLQILCAPIAMALAAGWRLGRLFAALAGSAIVFHVVCWATQLAFFSGCAYKPARHTALQLDAGSCLIVPSHLSALGEPLLGAAALARPPGWLSKSRWLRGSETTDS